jgi:N-acetylmuramoyl-L-alanine amidase CwlA
MSFKMKYIIKNDYLTAPSKRRSGKKISKVKFLVAHDTGNDGSTAQNNVNYYENSRNDMSASAHIFIDDVDIIECIPATTGTPEKAWHVLYNRNEDNNMFGEDANDAAIGVELCYSKTRGSINNLEAYKRYVWTLAYLCYKFSLEPTTKITGHFILDPARKTDPRNALSTLNKTFNDLIADVKAEYIDCTQTIPDKKSAPTPVTNKKDVSVLGRVTVIVDHLNVRNAPNLDSNIRRVVNKDDSFNVYEIKDGLFRISPTIDEWISGKNEYVKFIPSNNETVLGRVTVIVDHLNVRNSSNLDSNIRRVVDKDDSFNVYEIKNGLFRISPTIDEWISGKSEYVKFIPTNTEKILGRVTVIADHLNVRSAPDFNSSITRVVDKGNSFNVYEKKNGLYKIQPTKNEWISDNPQYVNFREA